MAEKEVFELAQERWAKLKILQIHYVEFNDFLIDVMETVMGFTCTDIQQDIGNFVAHGPQLRMVQAQRGEAKTTITAIYAVWRLIHDPSTRILIFSAGSDMATEIANWVIQIINSMEELECLRPDRSAGDRSSVTGFDVHHSLKGPEKSASITCLGLGSNSQGRRADVLIADDVESQKNSQTQVQRERTAHLTKDFASINQKGDIIWLGTPQSIDSIYNDLPGRGVTIRIWTGRYPTLDEEKQYDGFLAPLLKERMTKDPSLRTGGGPTGERGKPTDPILLNEDDLTKKEIDQGASYFQLQHMLSTKLSDKERFPLKLNQIRFLPIDRDDIKSVSLPMTITYVRTNENLIPANPGWPFKDAVYRVQKAEDYSALMKRDMYVDPSGGGMNGDEMAWACTGWMAGRVFLLGFGGVPGGLEEFQTEYMTQKVLKYLPHSVRIEENYGKGAFRNIWQPKLLKAIEQSKSQHKFSLEDVWEAGQKELRIIDTLEPILGSGRFVVAEELIAEDWAQCQQYPIDKRKTYSMFWQMSRITKDRKSLIHDDRLDAVAGSARYWTDLLVIDDEKIKAQQRNEAYRKMVQDPLGAGRPVQQWPGMGRIAPTFNQHGFGKIGRIGH